MKQQFAPKFARAVAPLLCATAFIATPRFRAGTPAAPPVVVTPPQTATVPPPPVVATIPDASTAPAAQPAATPAPRAAVALDCDAHRDSHNDRPPGARPCGGARCAGRGEAGTRTCGAAG